MGASVLAWLILLSFSYWILTIVDLTISMQIVQKELQVAS